MNAWIYAFSINQPLKEVSARLKDKLSISTLCVTIIFYWNECSRKNFIKWYQKVHVMLKKSHLTTKHWVEGKCNH